MDIWLFNTRRVTGLSRRWSTGNQIILPSILYLLFFSIPWLGNGAFCNVPGDEPAALTNQPEDEVETPANNIPPDEPDEEVGDELLLFEEFPVVVSAARQSQPINQLGVPISIITAEDIHNSGLTTIPEILQFYAGVDVFRIDRNRYAVGVRGLHDFTSDRTLILLNGRSANSPLWGGSEFWRLPVLMEDIERIEIVRGPGGAAWGANAFTGVINIITKEPGETDGVLASTTWNEYGDSYSHLRWGASAEKWSFRTSLGYNAQENSDKAGQGDYEALNPMLSPLIGFSFYEANDFNRSILFDGEAAYTLSEETSMFFGLGYSHVDMGDWEFGGFYPMDTSWLHTIRPYAKVEHEFDDDVTGYLQWYGNYANTKIPSLSKWSSSENDLEGQFNMELDEGHNLSFGGNYRYIHINIDSLTPQAVGFNGEPYDEAFAGLFVIDRWDASDDFTLEGQLRGDWYSETQTDWASRLSALYAMDPEKEHVLRVSAAKAYRAPLAALRESTLQGVSLAPLGFPGFYAWNVLLPDDLDNEETWSVEGGYTGRLGEGITLQANTYYQRYTRLIGYNMLPDPLPLDRFILQADNINGANAFGCEVEIEQKGEAGKLAAWYSFSAFDPDDHNQSVRAYEPARHKAGLRGTLYLGEDWTLNGNYKYSDVTKPLEMQPIRVDVDHRMDLTAARKVAEGKGEVMVGVTDLFDRSDGPNFSLGQLTAHDTPGRTFFLRLQFAF